VVWGWFSTRPGGKRRARAAHREVKPKRKTPPTEVGGAQGRTTCLTASSVATPGVGAGKRHSGRPPGRGFERRRAGEAGVRVTARSASARCIRWFALQVDVPSPAGEALARAGASARIAPVHRPIRWTV